jgi:hypothetical protein
MKTFLSILSAILLPIFFSDCSLYNFVVKDVPSPSTIQFDVTQILVIAEAGAFLNPSASIMLNSFVTGFHLYLVGLTLANSVLPSVAQFTADVQRLVATTGGATWANMVASVLISDYAKFYGASVALEPYIVALENATSFGAVQKATNKAEAVPLSALR